MVCDDRSWRGLARSRPSAWAAIGVFRDRPRLSCYGFVISPPVFKRKTGYAAEVLGVVGNDRPLVAEVNPLFPASGLAIGSLNGLNPKSKFLAFRADCQCDRCGQHHPSPSPVNENRPHHPVKKRHGRHPGRKKWLLADRVGRRRASPAPKAAQPSNASEPGSGTADTAETVTRSSRMLPPEPIDRL